MIDVGQHINYLILHHDCVIVPGSGAFIAQTTCADYDEEAEVFNGQRREIRFTAEVQHDDGLLIASIMRRHGVTREAAMHAINDFTAQKELHIPGIGVVNKEGFTPVPQGLYNSYQQVLPAINVTDRQKLRVTVVPESIIPRVSKSWMRYAAMIAMALGLMATAFLINDSTLHNLQQAAMSLFRPSIPPPTQEMKLPELKSTEVTLSIAAPTPEVEETVEVQAPIEKKYSVVVASFYTKKEALQHIASSHDPAMSYLGIGKYHRVIVAQADTYVEAYRMALKLDKKYPGAWALKNTPSKS